MHSHIFFDEVIKISQPNFKINPLELSRINNPTPSLLNILLFLITGHDY